MSRTIAISNQKGGVGKTTTAINISSCLAVNGNRVLLIDMDPQANASSGLGFYPAEQIQTIYDCLAGDVDLADVVQKTRIHNFSLVPANQELSGAEVELVNEFAREQRLKECIEPIKEEFDFIVIDTPPTLGLITVNALTAADSVLIPMQSEYYALEGLSQLLKTTSLIQKRLNPGLQREGILLTMYDRRNNLCQQVEEEIRKHFGDEVFTTVIPRNVKLSEAPSHGMPIILYDFGSRGNQAYMDVANEILDRYPQQPRRPQIHKTDLSTLTSPV